MHDGEKIDLGDGLFNEGIIVWGLDWLDSGKIT